MPSGKVLLAKLKEFANIPELEKPKNRLKFGLYFFDIVSLAFPGDSFSRNSFKS